MPSAGGSLLTIRPGRPLAGSFTPPGDKSITHRAYLMGWLARGETVVEGVNPGADCRATLAAAAALGAQVAVAPGGVRIVGCEGHPREAEGVLDCGNSGTTLRLLAGPLAALAGVSVLTGDASLRRRPVARIVEPLRRMGAQLWARDGDRLPPLVIRGAALSPLDLTLTVASAQVASCVLLAGMFATGVTTVALPGPARDHTERMLPAFGVPVRLGPARAGPPGGRTVSLTGPAHPVATRVRVPGDFSAAAFFLAAAAATPGSVVTARDVDLNPTRTGLLGVLERMGAQVERTHVREEGGEPVGDVTVTGPDRLKPCDIEAAQVPALVDEVPAWVVAATAARGRSRLCGAQELRVKESDRLAVLAAGLAGLGVAVEELPDGLVVTGGRVGGGRVAAADDHRIAMAFAVLAGRADGPVTVSGAAGIPTSYPGFAATLAALGGEVEGAGVEVGP